MSGSVADTVAAGNLALAVAVAAFAGLVSFASPCVLPLVPGFLGYVTGMSGSAGSRTRRRMLTGATLFVLGFSAVFLVETVVVSALGAALREHRGLVSRLGGVVIVLLAVAFLGAAGRRGYQPSWRPAAGLAGAPLLGAVFAVGWSPCMGPALGAILALATNLSGDSGQATRGLLLGVAYCLGLGVPFLLIAGGWSRATRVSAWLRRHQCGLQRTGGVLLLVIGVLLITGWWDGVVADWQRQLVQSFPAVV